MVIQPKNFLCLDTGLRAGGAGLSCSVVDGSQCSRHLRVSHDQVEPYVLELLLMTGESRGGLVLTVLDLTGPRCWVGHLRLDKLGSLLHDHKRIERLIVKDISEIGMIY